MKRFTGLGLVLLTLSSSALAETEQCSYFPVGNDHFFSTFGNPISSFVLSDDKSHMGYIDYTYSNNGISTYKTVVYNLKNGTKTEIGSGQAGSISLSPDGKYALYNGAIYETEKGKALDFKLPQYNYGIFSSDGKYYVTSQNMLDLANRQEQSLGEFILGEKAKGSSANNSQVSLLPDRSGAILWNLNTGKMTLRKFSGAPAENLDLKLPQGYTQNSLSFTADGKHVLAYVYKSTYTNSGYQTQAEAIVKSMEDKNEPEIHIPVDSSYGFSVRVLPGDKKYMLTTGLSKSTLVDIGKPDSKIAIEGETIEVSADGSRIILRDSDSSYTVKNLLTGENELSFSGNGSFIPQFSDQGRKILYSDSYGIARIRDLSNNSERTLSLGNFNSIIDEGKRIVGYRTTGVYNPEDPAHYNYNNSITLASTEQVCVNDRLQVEKDCKNCSASESKAQPIASPQQKLLDQLNLADLCKKDFDPDAWNKLLGQEVPNPVPVGLAKKYLLMFQKPGAFQPEKHLPVLIAILKSSIPKNEPELIAGAMEGVLASSNSLYADLTKRFEFAMPQPAAGQVRGSVCRSEAETAKLNDGLESYLVDLKAKNGPMTVLKDWKSLAPLSYGLRELEFGKKEALADDIATTLADHAHTYEQTFKNVFTSKLHYFSQAAIMPFFGLAVPEFVDLDLQRNHNYITPLILSTAPVDGDDSTASKYGFYFRQLGTESVSLGQSQDQYVKDFVWKHGKHQYTATLKAKRTGDDTLLVPKGDRPDYDGMWKDGTFEGIVIAGENLGSELGDSTLDQYLDYYQDKGFTFPDPDTTQLETISDVKAFLADKVKSGEAKYFIKEAHSDGDDRNIFRTSKTAKLLKGEKTLPDGKKEVVLLIYPNYSGGSDLISNKEFGEWMKAREEAKKSQMVYLNTSCSSTSKVANEVEAARSTLLIDVATTTMANTFTNEPNSALSMILTGLREKKSYEEIRSSLPSASEYSSGYDHYIFPDDSSYANNITAAFTPMDIDVQIKDFEGHPFILDQHIHMNQQPQLAAGQQGHAAIQ